MGCFVSQFTSVTAKFVVVNLRIGDANNSPRGQILSPEDLSQCDGGAHLAAPAAGLSELTASPVKR